MHSKHGNWLYHMAGYGAASNRTMTSSIRQVDETGTPLDGGTIRWALQKSPRTEPTSFSAYEWDVLDKLFDGLLTCIPSPSGHADVKWDVDTWEVGR